MLSKTPPATSINLPPPPTKTFQPPLPHQSPSINLPPPIKTFHHPLQRPKPYTGRREGGKDSKGKEESNGVPRKVDSNDSTNTAAYGSPKIRKMSSVKSIPRINCLFNETFHALQRCRASLFQAFKLPPIILNSFLEHQLHFFKKPYLKSRKLRDRMEPFKTQKFSKEIKTQREKPLL